MQQHREYDRGRAIGGSGRSGGTLWKIPCGSIRSIRVSAYPSTHDGSLGGGSSLAHHLAPSAAGHKLYEPGNRVLRAQARFAPGSYWVFRKSVVFNEASEKDAL